MIATSLLAVVLLATPLPPSHYDPEALAEMEAMGTAAAGVNDYIMTLVKRELDGTKLSPREAIVVKWQRPQSIYLHVIDGKREGQEVIYVAGRNKNRIKVHNMSLNPYGMLAMAHTHHPVPEVSLIHLVELVLDNVRRARAKNVGMLTFVGKETWYERPVTRLEATMPPTGTTPTLGKGQTLWDVAKATGQSMSVILRANRSRRWERADQPQPGDAVVVPDFYAGRMVLWIDDALKLPLQIDLYDHEGELYEHYEHHHLKVNVGLTAADFDPANPKYKF